MRGVSADTPSLLDEVTYSMKKSEGRLFCLSYIGRLSEQFDSSKDGIWDMRLVFVDATLV